MAGTFAEQATLAADNAFIATELFNSQAAQTLATLQQAKGILSNAGAQAPHNAALAAAGNPTIAAAAPAVPNDSDTQYAVNTVLTSLLK